MAHDPYVPPQLSINSLPDLWAVDFQRRNVAHNAGYFCRPNVDHVLMVFRLVVDVAGHILLFQAADCGALNLACQAMPMDGPTDRFERTA